MDRCQCRQLYISLYPNPRLKVQYFGCCVPTIVPILLVVGRAGWCACQLEAAIAHDVDKKNSSGTRNVLSLCMEGLFQILDASHILSIHSELISSQICTLVGVSIFPTARRFEPGTATEFWHDTPRFWRAILSRSLSTVDQRLIGL
jgi:hypothetical protein